jgi:hypothetical protein
MAIKGLMLTVGVAVLLAAPGTASAAKPTSTPGKGHGKAKAYGKYCQGESKKHVEGEKGTAFSRCVKAMAKADKETTGGTEATSPAKACKGLRKKHVKGDKGTAYSRCVVAAVRLQKDKEEQDSEAATS